MNTPKLLASQTSPFARMTAKRSKTPFALPAAALLALLGVSVAHADTYIWTQKATGNYDWTTAGNWDSNNQFVSGSGNELKFFADTVNYLSPDNAIITITNVPASLSMNTLTLSGRGPNGARIAYVTIGDNTSTWTIGDGTTSIVNLDTTKGGGHAAEVDDIRWTIAPNLQLNQTTTTFTGNGIDYHGFTFSGNVTESAAGFGIIKSGSSILTFSGNNSYTGTTLVSGGVLRLGSANALPGGIGTTGGTSALTINGTGVVEMASGDFSRNLGTGSDQFQITSGTSGFSARGGPRNITVNGDASQEVVWGSASFNPSTLVLNASTADSALTFSNKIDLNAATRTVQVNASGGVLSNVIQTSGGTAGLTKNGSGTLYLSGANTYNGTTKISAGTLSVGAANNLGDASADLVFDGGTLQVTGTSLTSISGIGHAVTFTNNKAVGFEINNANNTFTVDQTLNQGTGTLSKSGVGTLVLSQDSTYTGATTATGGGKLVLDYSTNNGSKLGNTSALNLNGGSLVLRGGSHAEAIGSIVVAANTGNSISRDVGSAATIANTGVLTMNTLSNLTIAEAGIVSTTTANHASGIQTLGRVTAGSHFATNDSNLLIAYGGYGLYTAAAGGGDLNTVNQLTGGGTLAGNITSYSLRIANGGNSDVLDLGTNKLLNVSNVGTVLYAGGFDNNYTINGTGSAAVRASSGNQPVNMNIFTGTLTVNALLTSQGGSTLVKAGGGTLVVGGSNSYTNATYIQQGVLRLTNASGLGATNTGTFVQGGAALELSNNIAVGAEALTIDGAGISNGGALRNNSGSNSYGGQITLGASGARINSDASSSLTLTGGIDTTYGSDLTIGGEGSTTVSTTAVSGGGSVIKDGAGTLTLAASNTYAGATTVSGGTLLVSGSISGSAATVSNAGSVLGGTGTVGGVTVNGDAILQGGDGVLASGALSSAGDVSLTDGSIIRLTLGAGNTHSSLARTGGIWSFDSNQAFSFTATQAGSFDNIISGLAGTESNLITGGSTAWNFSDANWTYTFTYDGAGGFGAGNVDLAIVAVPEPGAVVSLLSGLGMLVGLQRFRRKQASA